MIKIQKTTGGTISYLTDSESIFEKSVDRLTEAEFMQQMMKIKNHSFSEFQQNIQEYKRLYSIHKDSYEEYMSKNTSHHKATFKGALAEKFNLEYSSENFTKLKNGYFPGTEKQFNEIYKKDKQKNLSINKKDKSLSLNKDIRGLSLIKQSPPKSKKDKKAGKNKTQQGDSLVFACPKGLSMLYAVADKDIQSKINSALDKAVDEVMKEYALKLLPSTKDYQDKIDNSKTALVYASFDHIENRDIEAHKHRHIEVANFAEFTFKDGTKKILAPDTKDIYSDIKELTSAFNALLVSELDRAGIKTKAYDEKNLDFSFSIVGIDRKKEKELIKRKDEIESFMNESKSLGKTYNTFELAAFDYDYQKETNRMKSYQGLDEIARKSTQKEKDKSLNSKDLHENIKQSTSLIVSYEDIAKAQINFTSKKQTFDIKKIINSSKLEINGEVKKSEIIAEIYNQLKFTDKFNNLNELKEKSTIIYDDLIKSQKLVVKENGLITSHQIIKDEFDMAKNIEKLKYFDNQAKQQPNTKFVNDFQAKFKLTMNTEQFAGCEELTKCKRLTIIEGAAGVGKTTTLINLTNQLYKSMNKEVFALATQQNTANAMKEVGIKNTFNITDFLGQVESGKIDIKNSALIIDEAGMVGTSHYKQLTDLALQNNCNLILVGDRKQLASVSQGDGFSQIIETAKDYINVSINQRQKDPITFKIAEAFKERKIDEAFQIIKENELLTTGKTTDEVNKKLVDDYMNDKSKTKIILASTNNEVNSINDMIKERLKEERIKNNQQVHKEVKILIELNGNEYERSFAKEDEIIFTKNMKIDKSLKLLNGERGKIVNIHNKNLTFEIERIDDNQKIVKTQHTINTDDFNCFNHSYACTTHKSQGKTVDTTFVKGSANSNANSAYVNFSRQKTKVALYVEEDNLDKFIQNSKNLQVKATTINDKNCQKALASYLAERNHDLTLKEITEKINELAIVKKTKIEPPIKKIEERSLLSHQDSFNKIQQAKTQSAKTQEKQTFRQKIEAYKDSIKTPEQQKPIQQKRPGMRM